MMIRAGFHLRALMLLLALAWLAAAFGAAQPAAQARPAPQLNAACALRIQQLAQQRDWRAELRDPVIHTEDELRGWVEQYRPAHDCLVTAGDGLTDELRDLRGLAGLFLSLAGEFVDPRAGQGAGRGYLLTFAEIQDPAVITLREEIGLPAPPGYVYIWLYPSREAMPAQLAAFFANDATRGVTVLTRYIIVIDPLADPQSASQPALSERQRDQRSRTLSHEFVHAYVKASLGPERGFALPTWFDEGLAIYLSGSSQPSAITYYDESGQVISITTATEDYARYRDMFSHLEDAYGRAGLFSRIRQALLDNDPARLYRELGAISESELYAMSEAVRVRRSLARIAVFAGIPLGALLLLAVTRLLFPAVGAIFPGLAGLRLGLNRGKSPEDVHWLKTRQNLPALARLLSYSHPRRPQEAAYVRQTAAQALRELGRPEAVDPLIAALDDGNSLVRAEAARALGELCNAHNRAQIVAALFPRFAAEPTGEARWALAQALYQAGGETVIRPLEAAIRRWLRRPTSRGSQTAFVDWAAENELYGAMIDLYPWLEPGARREVASCLLRELSPLLLERLSQACDSGDPDLRELAETIVGSC